MPKHEKKPVITEECLDKNKQEDQLPRIRIKESTTLETQLKFSNITDAEKSEHKT